MITDQAFILHKRAYKDSSELIKLITLNNGIIDVIAKGSQRPKSKLKGQLQPFTLTQVNMVGKSALKTLIDAEQTAVLKRCNYINHVSMLYCNELLTLIRIDEQASQSIFVVYQQTVQALQQTTSVRQALRRFEWHLCCQLGYELQLPNDANEGDCLEFDAINGLIINNTQQRNRTFQPCTVQSFIQFINSEPMTSEQLNEISNLMRVVINHLVNGKTIQSRHLLKTNIDLKS